MAEKIISPSKSFEGWNLKKWFMGNWGTLKELIKVGLPMVVGWFATQNPIWTIVITALGKLILDSGEYFFKKYSE